MRVAHSVSGLLGVDNFDEKDGVYLYGDIVLCDGSLRGYVYGFLLEREDVGNAVHKGQKKVQSGVEYFVEFSEALYDPGGLLRHDDDSRVPWRVVSGEMRGHEAAREGQGPHSEAPRRPGPHFVNLEKSGTARLFQGRGSFCTSLGMKLVTYCVSSEPGNRRLGAVLDPDHIVDLQTKLNITGGMKQLLERGQSALEDAKRILQDPNTPKIPMHTVTLLAPIYDPEKIICVGMNYRDHCIEQNFPIPQVPLLFSKFASSIAATGDCIPYDKRETQELDPEIELVVVVGKECKRVSASEAPSYIAGYTVANDVSARDLQMKSNGGQWLLGKTGDGYAPIGPCIVTPDDLPSPLHVNVRCIVNGKEMQSSNTRELVHDPADVVAYASRFMTLKAGDLIFTGTPGGVGVFRKPPVFLGDGDEVTCEIDGIGSITNRVVQVGE